jgi:hypothetical protein
MDMTKSATAGPYRLEVTARPSGGTLAVVYRFFNDGARNVYLFNRLYTGIGNDGLYQTRRDLLNVEIDRTHIILSKRIFGVPPDLDVERPNVPCVTLVRPKSHFEETIHLALPLKPVNPYHLPDDAHLAGPPLTPPLWFELGYFVAPPESDALARSVRTAEGPALRFDPFPVSSQAILRAGPFELAVPARPEK